MSAPRITAIAATSPADAVGLQVGDELLALNGRAPRDVIEYAQLADEAHLELVVRRKGDVLDGGITVHKEAGAPLGIEVSSPVFDRVRTCDNHCPFCFIHQLPKGLRRSLYLKDDDYRLSFLYGNFTTLTRFTELDVERVIDERLGPLYVSIHATDPAVRTCLLRNPRGATSLRWLRVLLAAGIEIHGQIVVCPGINDGAVLEQTLTDILDEYPELSSVGLVPLGISRYTKEPELRAHTQAEAEAVCDLVGEWQSIFSSVLGRRLAFAADEYYLMAGRPFPPLDDYEDLPQHENGIGMARTFASSFAGSGKGRGTKSGFFASVDGAPATGYRAVPVTLASRHRPPGAREPAPDASQVDAPQVDAPQVNAPQVAVVTGSYGAEVLAPLLQQHRRRHPEAAPVRLIPVANEFFGGNIGVAGLLTGTDLQKALEREPEDHRYLLPDACLSNGRFLDGIELHELPRPVEVVEASGSGLRRALDGAGPAGGTS